MELYRFLPIFLWLLLYGLIPGHLLAEEERSKYGQNWNSWNDSHRIVYLLGLKDGMKERGLEQYYVELALYRRGLVTDTDARNKALLKDLYPKALTPNFPELKVLRDVMTKFYADPANTYLDFRTIFVVSVAKLRGASPELIEKILSTARKTSYGLYKFSQTGDPIYLQTGGKSNRDLFYKEVLKIK